VTERVNRETGQVGWPDLQEFSRRFPDQYVEKKDGQEYVAHHVINQRLLSVVGPFDFQLVEILRSDVPAVPSDPTAKGKRAQRGTPALQQVVTGGVWRLTCEVDGRRTQVEEVGDADPHNNATDGGRLKDAASDALKRCAMRLGLGLHLWAQEHYFLDKQLAVQAAPQPTPVERAQEHHERGRDQRQGSLSRVEEPAWAGAKQDGSP
jgi:hypothetical protein